MCTKQKLTMVQYHWFSTVCKLIQKFNRECDRFFGYLKKYHLYAWF